MKLIAEKPEYKIYRRRDGKYWVKNNCGVTINGTEKVDILSKEGLIHKNNGSNGLS